MSEKHKRVYYPFKAKKDSERTRLSLDIRPDVVKRIDEIAESRYPFTRSSVFRELIYMGLEEYDRRAKYGIIRKPERESYKAQCEAVAARIQDEREARRRARRKSQQPTLPAVLLIDGVEDKNE